MESKVSQGDLEAFGVKTKINGQELYYYFSYLGIERLNLGLRERSLDVQAVVGMDMVALTVLGWSGLSHYVGLFDSVEDYGDALVAEARKERISFPERVAREGVPATEAFMAKEKDEDAPLAEKKPAKKKRSK